MLISIVIPVKNGGFWLENLLRKLMQQTLFHQSEIIVIDSGSTDDSLEIAGRYPVSILQIQPEAFNHGVTRNLGVDAAKGEFVVMIVQDAIPALDDWLEKLLDGFADAKVAGVCGQQIVPHDTSMNPISWFRPISAPEKVTYSVSNKDDFGRLTPDEKKRYCSWDNVNAMYRKEVLRKIPFRKIPFAEDAQWAMDALMDGYSIVYTSFARVYHYHYDSPAVVYKRVFNECYARYTLFGFIPGMEPGFTRFLKDVKVLLPEKKITFSKKIFWLIYNYRIRSSANHAVKEFKRCVARGNDYLNLKFLEICGDAQQAQRPVSSSIEIG